MNKTDAKTIGTTAALNMEEPVACCPDCGYHLIPTTDEVVGDSTDPFKCPRCRAYYDNDEFWRLHHEKSSGEADLTGEQQHEH